MLEFCNRKYFLQNLFFLNRCFVSCKNINISALALVSKSRTLVMKGIISLYVVTKYAKLRFTTYNDVSLTYHVKLS